MKTLRSISKFLKAGKVAPIHLDYSISKVGLMSFVGKMGSGNINDEISLKWTDQNVSLKG
jgi:hypothetical protein